jgi:Uncharacterized protein conserved in bacteria
VSRRSDIDWVRMVSICGVVLIHSSSLFVSRQSRVSILGVTPALLCNQVTRFSVPVFFILSGLGLSLSEKPLKLPDFWLHRLRRVGIPYILWTLFYYLFDKQFTLKGLLSINGLAASGRLLLTGGAASHLWYIPVLLQLNLLYPALKWLMKRFPFLTLLSSFMISMFSTLMLYIPLPITGWWRPHLWRLFPTWVFYFVLGMALTEKRIEQTKKLAKSHMPVFVIIMIIAAFMYTWDAQNSGNLDSIKPQLFLYSPLCFALMVSLLTQFERFPNMQSISAFIARHSMTVYFSHIFFLRMLRQISFFNRNSLTMFLTFVAVMTLSTLTSIVPELSKHLLNKIRNNRLLY